MITLEVLKGVETIFYNKNNNAINLKLQFL
jgi:hypothetical protein